MNEDPFQNEMRSRAPRGVSRLPVGGRGPSLRPPADVLPARRYLG